MTLAPINLEFDTQQFGELAGEILQSGFGVRFKAKGQSMRPSILEDDILLVEPVLAEAVRRGDVLLFVNSNGRAIAHRVQKRRATKGIPEFLMRGDQVAVPEGWIDAQDVLGVVSSVERNGKVFLSNKPALKVLGYAATCYKPGNRMNHAAFSVVFRMLKVFVK